MPAKTRVTQSHVRNKVNYHQGGLFFSLFVVALGIVKISIYPSIFVFSWNTLDHLETIVREVQEGTNTNKAMEELDSSLI